MQQQIWNDCNNSVQQDASYCHKLHRLLEHCMQHIVIIHQQLKSAPAHSQQLEILQQRLYDLQQRRRFYQAQLMNLPGFSDLPQTCLTCPELSELP